MVSLCNYDVTAFLSLVAVADDHAARLAVGEFVEIEFHYVLETISNSLGEHCDEPKDVAEFVGDVLSEFFARSALDDDFVVVDRDFTTANGLCNLVGHLSHFGHKAKGEIRDVFSRVAGNGAVGLLLVFCCCHCFDV